MHKNETIKLFFIKLFHTIIWVVFVILISYILYSSIKNIVNAFTFIAILIVGIEGVILFLNGWKCPLTTIAEKYDNKREIGFDIFLPKWLAKDNKVIFTVLYLSGITIVILRLLTK
ncbi:hypothetical protein [Candidatus Contubernalis alkaliaceticus]|uniref:hypothetical protein n=1 Tax=Candidatus Contubernalis alkaliaceticus TaxID=338645 RepID=UPI001F4C1B19|nr:hypothetical protein [Candidatus Contubernalis alkalaceticus]UNC92162.1 hypothetical protein HUE98_08680 [Candidatus Contubernalis alkalaceticus]